MENETTSENQFGTRGQFCFGTDGDWKPPGLASVVPNDRGNIIVTLHGFGERVNIEMEPGYAEDVAGQLRAVMESLEAGGEG